AHRELAAVPIQVAVVDEIRAQSRAPHRFAKARQTRPRRCRVVRTGDVCDAPAPLLDQVFGRSSAPGVVVHIDKADLLRLRRPPAEHHRDAAGVQSRGQRVRLVQGEHQDGIDMPAHQGLLEARRASSLTLGLPLKTREAVARDTPAARATWSSVAAVRETASMDTPSGAISRARGTAAVNGRVLKAPRTTWNRNATPRLFEVARRAWPAGLHDVLTIRFCSTVLALTHDAREARIWGRASQRMGAQRLHKCSHVVVKNSRLDSVCGRDHNAVLDSPVGSYGVVTAEDRKGSQCHLAFAPSGSSCS